MDYQLDLRTPISSPAFAHSRIQIRQRLNLPIYHCDLPQFEHLWYNRVENSGFFPSTRERSAFFWACWHLCTIAVRAIKDWITNYELLRFKRNYFEKGKPSLSRSAFEWSFEVVFILIVTCKPCGLTTSSWGTSGNIVCSLIPKW